MPPNIAKPVPRRNNKNEAAKQQMTLIPQQRMKRLAGRFPDWSLGTIRSSMTDGKNASAKAKAGDLGFAGSPASDKFPETLCGNARAAKKVRNARVAKMFVMEMFRKGPNLPP